jgi:hypothetical protein
MRFFLSLLWATCFLPRLLSAQGLAFLDYPPDAQSMALGGTGSSYRNNIYALQLNPAGLVGNQNTGATAGIANLIWLGNSKGYNGSIVQQSAKSGIGAYFSTLSNGNQSNDIGVQVLTVGTAYAHKIKNLQVGVGVKYLSEFINDLRFRGYAADIGAQWNLKDLNFGVSLLNIGKMNDSQASTLPTNLKGGFSMIPLRLSSQDTGKSLVRIRFTAEAGYSLVNTEDPLKIYTGLEAKFFDFFYARAGYQSNDPIRKSTLGIGMEKETLSLDYAYIPFRDDAGSGHLLVIAFKL